MESHVVAPELVRQSVRHKPLAAWNSTATPFPSDTCAHQLFERQAALMPGDVAVAFQDDSLTYRELNERANQVAHFLRRAGVGPNVLAGISLERSLDMVVGIYGILKAGGAYVPLDPAYPEERLAFMLEDARAKVLLTKANLAGKFGNTTAKVICLDTARDEIARESRENPAPTAGPDNLIYVIYTSGSTGRPKGAGVYHRGFTNLMHWFVTEFGIDARDNSLLVSSLSFDLTQKNLYATLMRGGQLHLLPDGPYDPARIADLIQAHKITLLNCTPSAFYPLIEPPDAKVFQKVAALRCVFLGGEPISIPRLRPWLENEHCRAEVDNTYGPTECTDISAFYRMNRANLDQYETVPIGRPVYNAQLAIVDEDFRPCDIGVAGELCIGGTGIGAGYLNDSAMTAARFVANPFPEITGNKLYKTGDLARYHTDGNIEFLGRMDHQVKIRGFRIELREIEGALAAHGDVREAVVVVHKSGAADSEPRLTAYFSAKNGSVPDAAALRQFLKQKLPEYMVPSAFMHLERFPLSPNGKVDRRALAALEAPLTGVAASAAPPQTEAEQAIARIWQETLEVSQVGLTDNFFDLGGNSLSLARVHGRLREHFKTDLPITALFEFTTVSALAKHLSGGNTANGLSQFADRASKQRQALANRRQPGTRS
jgi:amino acid adenylation domain-containing protein